jgi:trafficking protein particle complex subunit 5
MSQLPKGGAGGAGPSKEGLRYPSNGKTIYHRPLNRTKTAELSGAAFAYLFSEMVSYASVKISSIQDLEKRYVHHLSSLSPSSIPTPDLP